MSTMVAMNAYSRFSDFLFVILRWCILRISGRGIGFVQQDYGRNEIYLANNSSMRLGLSSSKTLPLCPMPTPQCVFVWLELPIICCTGTARQTHTHTTPHVDNVQSCASRAICLQAFCYCLCYCSLGASNITCWASGYLFVIEQMHNKNIQTHTHTHFEYVYVVRYVQ